MRSRLLLAFCTVLALVVGSRADDKDDKKATQDKAKQQKKETVAKPMTEKQKRQAEEPAAKRAGVALQEVAG